MLGQCWIKHKILSSTLHFVSFSPQHTLCGCQRGLAHLTQGVPKIPHKQRHVFMPGTELGAFPSTGKSVAVDPLNPVHYCLCHSIQRRLLGKLCGYHGCDFLSREGGGGAGRGRMFRDFGGNLFLPSDIRVFNGNSSDYDACQSHLLI